MIAFEYLHHMMDVFGPLMDEWARGDNRHIENEEDEDVSISIIMCIITYKLLYRRSLMPMNLLVPLPELLSCL